MKQVSNGNVHDLSPTAFQLLLRWLHPVLPSRSKLDTSLHASEEDDETISSTTTPYDGRYLDNSQKLLLVLMCIRQGLAQEDLAFRFDVEQSSVSRILNRWIPLLSYHLKGLIKWPEPPLDQWSLHTTTCLTQYLSPMVLGYSSRGQQSEHPKVILLCLQESQYSQIFGFHRPIHRCV